jgi:hypothetical protein
MIPTQPTSKYYGPNQIVDVGCNKLVFEVYISAYDKYFLLCQKNKLNKRYRKM